MATMKSWPWLTLPLLVGFGVGLRRLFRHMQRMVFGEPPPGRSRSRRTCCAVVVHLVLVLLLGLAIPAFLSRCVRAGHAAHRGASRYDVAG